MKHTFMGKILCVDCGINANLFQVYINSLDDNEGVYIKLCEECYDQRIESEELED